MYIVEEKKLRSIIRKLLEKRQRTLTGLMKSDADATKLAPIQFDFDSISNSSVVTIAKSESDFWENGELKETDEKAYDRLNSYWSEGAGWSESQWEPGKTPWSAAFISYCMKKSGESFYDAAAHYVYAKKALDNRKKLDEDPNSLSGTEDYVLFLKGEAEPVPGDVLFYVRSGNIKSWIAGGGGEIASHCDIFIGGGLAIGGNLGNSCKETKAFGKHEAIIKKVKVGKATEGEEGDDSITGLGTAGDIALATPLAGGVVAYKAAEAGKEFFTPDKKKD